MQDRIIDNMQLLATQKGFQNVTMDELAARAGISKRTIYRYFRSKDDLVEAVIDRFMANVARTMDSILAQEKDLATIFTRLIEHIPQTSGALINNPLVLNDLRSCYPHLWAKIDDFRVAKIKNILQRIIEQKKAGQVREINPNIITTAFLASVRAVVNPDFILKHNLTLSATVEQLVDLFVHGFGAKQ